MYIIKLFCLVFVCEIVFDTDRIVNFTKEYVRTIRTTFELIIRSFIATTLFSGFLPHSEFELMKGLKIQVRIEI